MNKLGNKNIIKKMFGNKEILKEVLNGQEIYSAEEELLPYVMFSSPSYFTIQQSAYLQYDGTLEYSTDKSTWNTWTYQSVSGTLNNGLYKVYIRGSNNTYVRARSDSTKSTFSIDSRDDIYVSGNLNSLLDYKTNYDTLINMDTQTFHRLFYKITAITNASKLILPAITLTEGCYIDMFNGCTSLVSAPALPATTLAQSCYYNMFYGCSSLTTSPSLSATTLATLCYASMFQGCVNLETLPVLPATSLPIRCYSEMFSGCSKIKISETQTEEYQTAFRIPTTGTGTESQNSLEDMFASTGGTFTGTPSINTTYYTSNTIV